MPPACLGVSMDCESGSLIDEITHIQKDPGVREGAGFSLIELLVGIAILSILIGIAVPDFQALVKETRQVSFYNKVSSTLRFARSEAIKRSSAVSICAWASDSSCGTDWSNGMLVFTDAAKDGSILAYDGTDVIVRPVSVPNSNVAISSTALLSSDSTAPVATSVIRFDERGRPDWINGTIVLCDDRGASHARALIMTGSGIGRRAYSTPVSKGVVVDARGIAVSCT